MTDGTVERLNYFQRQFLGAEDFNAQQDYHRSMRRRHNLAHHTWGIVAGLELFSQRQEGRTGAQVDIFLMPGMAVDGFGREIFVFAPRKLDFGDEPPPASGRSVAVWIAYTEDPARRAGECEKGEEPAGARRTSREDCATRTIAGFELPAASYQYSRVSESYRLYLLPSQPYHDNIVLDGEEIDTDGLSDPTPQAGQERQELAPRGIYADESVPHQELPNEAARPEWLIPLGSVLWDGTSFVEDPNDAEAYKKLLKQGRQYVGVVASQVLAPGGALRIRDRMTDPLRPVATDPIDDPGVEVDLEGQLRVHRLLTAKKDIQVHGGTLDFRVDDGTNLDPNGNAYPTTAKRNNLGLEVTAGRKRASNTDPLSQFKVGFDDNNSFSPVLSVENTGEVEITGNLEVSGSLSLSGALDIADVEGDRLVLWGTADDPAAAALGIEEAGDTLYHKANARHRWYIQHNRDAGASEKMSLDSTRLRLTIPLRMEKEIDFDVKTGDLVMLDGPIDQFDSSGFGFDAGTLYARAKQRHRWFVGALANSGAQAMELDANRLTVNRAVTVTGNNLTLNSADLLVVSGVIGFNDVGGDKVMLFGQAGTQQAYGFGIENGTLYARSNGLFRWYVGRMSDNGGNDTMELSSSQLTLNGNLVLNNGGLRISGGTTIRNLQAGTTVESLPANAVENPNVQINFPTSFPAGVIPRVMATATETTGVSIALTTTNVTNGGFSMVARRVDNSQNSPAVNFNVSWFAWE